jgi:nitrogen regulatory protein PII
VKGLAPLNDKLGHAAISYALRRVSTARCYLETRGKADRRAQGSCAPRPRLTPAKVAAYSSPQSRLPEIIPHAPEAVLQLLIAVINEEEKLDQILAGLLELGVTGATIVQSEGMGRVVSHDVPIFAGLERLASFSRPRNQTIFSVIKEEDKVDGVIALLREICGDLDDPATGIVFTIPVNRVEGLSPEFGDRG